MKLTRLYMRAAAVPLAWLLVGATPATRVIPLPGNPHEALIIPAGSPVQFRGFDKDGKARFSGKFVLTGSFAYGCRIDCEGPAKDAFFRFDVEPDPALAARLPRWKVRGNDIRIVVSREAPLVRKVTTRQLRADIKSQRIPGIQGRISILVEEFETGLECDSASFSARFVSLLEAPKFAKAEFNGNYGCG